MEGGAKTGFRHVEPEEYVPRLLKFNGKGRHVTVSEVRPGRRRRHRHVTASDVCICLVAAASSAGCLHRCFVLHQVPCTRARLNSDDVFIYDGGRQLYQWNGTGANKDERFKVSHWFQGQQPVSTVVTSFNVTSFKVSDQFQGQSPNSRSAASFEVNHQHNAVY